MAAESSAKFEIEIVSDAKSAITAEAALRKLQNSVRDSEDAINMYREQLKQLRKQVGDTSAEQDKARKLMEAAKGVRNQEREAITKQRMAIVDFRTSVKDQAKAAKETEERNKAMGASLRAVGGPVQDVRDRFESLKTIMGDGSSSTVALAGGISLLVVGIAALSAGVIAATVSFAKWALGVGDAQRSLVLLQEAAAGSAENSKAMTMQIDAMSRIVPTSRIELQKLYQETFRLSNFTTMNGQSIQDTYAAIAQSSAAMGDTVGKQIGDLVLRSKQVGVVRITPLDVQGTGLDYEKDFVQPLAKSMAKAGPITAKSMADARAALQVGGLKIDAGAKVVADAVNKRFGNINARQMLSLDVQWKRLHETIESFTRGIDLEPLLKTVDHLFALLRPENDVGASIKQLVELLGNGLVGAASDGEPAIQSLFEQAIILAQEATLAFLENREAIVKLFDVDLHGTVDTIREIVVEVKELAKGLSAVAGVVSKVQRVQSIVGGAAVGDALGDVGYQAGNKIRKLFGGGDSAVSGAAPSKSGGASVVAPANSDGGVVGKPAPGEFWASVAPGETIVPAGKASTAGGGASGGGSSPRRVSGEITVKLVVSGDGGRPAGEIVESMRSSGLLAELTDLIESTFQGGGIPVGAASP